LSEIIRVIHVDVMHRNRVVKKPCCLAYSTGVVLHAGYMSPLKTLSAPSRDAEVGGHLFRSSEIIRAIHVDIMHRNRVVKKPCCLAYSTGVVLHAGYLPH
jgi:hypothetical protein